MATVESFLSRVRSDVPGCPEPVMMAAVIDATVEFCKKTTIWRVDHAAIDLVADQAVYPLTIPADAVLETLTAVQESGSPLEGTTPDQLDVDWPGYSTRVKGDSRNLYGSEAVVQTDPWRTRKSSQASVYYLPDKTSIRLVEIPSGAKLGALTITMALKPTRTAATLPDVLYDDWFEGIAHGALMRLMAKPGKAWSNVEVTRYHAARFGRAIGEAEGVADRYNTRNPPAGRTRAYF